MDVSVYLFVVGNVLYYRISEVCIKYTISIENKTLRQHPHYIVFTHIFTKSQFWEGDRVEKRVG